MLIPRRPGLPPRLAKPGAVPSIGSDPTVGSEPTTTLYLTEAGATTSLGSPGVGLSPPGLWSTEPATTGGDVDRDASVSPDSTPQEFVGTTFVNDADQATYALVHRSVSRPLDVDQTIPAGRVSLEILVAAAAPDGPGFPVDFRARVSVYRPSTSTVVAVLTGAGFSDDLDLGTITALAGPTSSLYSGSKTSPTAVAALAGDVLLVEVYANVDFALHLYLFGGTVTAYAGFGGGTPSSPTDERAYVCVPGALTFAAAASSLSETGDTTLVVAHAETETVAEPGATSLVVSTTEAEALLEVGATTLAAVTTEAEAAAETGSTTLAVAQAGADALGDSGGTSAGASHASAEALAETGATALAAAQAGVEALREIGATALAVAKAALEAVAETAATLLQAVQAGADAVGESGGTTASPAASGAEALSETLSTAVAAAQAALESLAEAGGSILVVDLAADESTLTPEPPISETGDTALTVAVALAETVAETGETGLAVGHAAAEATEEVEPPAPEPVVPVGNGGGTNWKRRSGYVSRIIDLRRPRLRRPTPPPIREVGDVYLTVRLDALERLAGPPIRSAPIRTDPEAPGRLGDDLDRELAIILQPGETVDEADEEDALVALSLLLS